MLCTFYDFHRQLWLSNNKNLSEALHPPKEKPQKPKGKEEKAAPVEKVTVEDLFRQFEENPPSDMDPCLRLWEIFNNFFLQTSVDKNLFSLKELALAGGKRHLGHTFLCKRGCQALVSDKTSGIPSTLS